ncbi:MAG TPA: hypothetical protein VIJ51_13790 [Solirubrobacteraceae bacterium]
MISRRPDAITDAQFWAEDGTIFYANVYAHGVLATLVVPIGGYLNALPVLVTGIARTVPLTQAPLVTNLAAIAVQVLPVGLLLGRRAATISPKLAVRVLLAALYIGLPGAASVDANITDAGASGDRGRARPCAGAAKAGLGPGRRRRDSPGLRPDRGVLDRACPARLRAAPPTRRGSGRSLAGGY